MAVCPKCKQHINHLVASKIYTAHVTRIFDLTLDENQGVIDTEDFTEAGNDHDYGIDFRDIISETISCPNCEEEILAPDRFDDNTGIIDLLSNHDAKFTATIRYDDRLATDFITKWSKSIMMEYPNANLIFTPIRQDAIIFVSIDSIDSDSFAEAKTIRDVITTIISEVEDGV